MQFQPVKSINHFSQLKFTCLFVSDEPIWLVFWINEMPSIKSTLSSVGEAIMIVWVNSICSQVVTSIIPLSYRFHIFICFFKKNTAVSIREFTNHFFSSKTFRFVKSGIFYIYSMKKRSLGRVWGKYYRPVLVDWLHYSCELSHHFVLISQCLKVMFLRN